MKILKKNQLIILVISLMLMTAGYLNFTSQDVEKENLAALGDATLVSGNAIENEVVENIIENNVTEEENISVTKNKEENNNENNIEETNAVITNTEEETDNYFVQSKLERENMYSQILETYQEIYNNINSTAEQKSEAINKITEMNNEKNAIMIAENLVIAKGFKNIVIFANDNSVSVIIEAEALEPEQIAQIQNIVSRELEVGAELINISTK